MQTPAWTSMTQTHPGLKKEVLRKCFAVTRTRRTKPEIGPPKLERFDT